MTLVMLLFKKKGIVREIEKEIKMSLSEREKEKKTILRFSCLKQGKNKRRKRNKRRRKRQFHC